MRGQKVIIEGATLEDMRALIESRDEWGDEGAPIWVSPTMGIEQRGILQWSVIAAGEKDNAREGKIRAEAVTGKGVSLAFEAPDFFPDPGAFSLLTDKTIAELERRGYQMRNAGPLPSNPPNPQVRGWDAVFEWYYQWMEENAQKMTLKDLAAKLHRNYDDVRAKRAAYDEVMRYNQKISDTEHN